MFSDLTFGPSYNVQRWFTGFGELSFRWIQICIGSPMHRSSYNCESCKISAAKIPNECLWHEKWPVWGYVGIEL